MNEINPVARKLQQAKNCRLSRLFHPPLISLIYAALMWTLAALGLVSYPPPPGGDRRDRGAADLGELPGGRPAAKTLTAAELDERVPLSPQEAALFGPGKGERTRRAVYQAAATLTQGGTIERYMRDIAALIGRTVRTVQRAYKHLEERGLSVRRHRKTSPAWNLPNRFRFLLRERQLPIFFQNVAQSRKNLKQETKTPKNSTQEEAGMWKSCRTRPANHPPEVRAAWERRRRANHPPEMRQKFEERAAFWKHMRGWRPTAAQNTARHMQQANRALVGAHFESEELRVVATIACAVRLGMSKRAAKKLELDWRADRVHELAEPDEPELTERGGSKQPPPCFDPGEAKLPPPVLTQAAELPQAAIDEPEPQAEPAIAAECPLCEGRRRRVLGGRIVVCSCSPDSWADTL